MKTERQADKIFDTERRVEELNNKIAEDKVKIQKITDLNEELRNCFDEERAVTNDEIQKLETEIEEIHAQNDRV